MTKHWRHKFRQHGWRWLSLLLLGIYLLVLAWVIVVPDVKRTIADTNRWYARWGTVKGSGIWRGDDGLAEVIERAAHCIRAGDKVAVWSGSGVDKIRDWKNLGALAGWFMPRGATLVSADDPTPVVANVVLSDETIGRPPLSDDWQCVHDEWAAKIYRFMPGSGADVGKYTRYYLDLPQASSDAWPPFQQVTRRLAIIFAACMVWMVSGWLMLRSLAVEWLRGVARGVVALVTGALACSVLVLGWLLLGLPVGWQPLGMSVLLLGGGWWMSHALRAHDTVPSLVGRDYIWQSVLALSWMIFAVFGAWVTLSSDANGVPDLGHYGIKAKAFFLEGGVSGDFPGGERWRLHAPSYPLGGAMMLEWLFSWQGAADIHLGRVTQGMWLGAAAVLVAAWLRSRGLPAILAWGVGFLPLGTSGSLFYLTNYYQEVLLNVPLLAGLFLIVDSIENTPTENQDHGNSRGNEALIEAPNEARNASEARTPPLRIEPPHVGCYEQGWAGALLLSACAWIKADGLLLWCAVAFVWLILQRRSQLGMVLSATILGTAVWVLPWRCWLTYADVGIGDFSFTQLWSRDWQGHANVLATVGQRLLKLMNAHGGTYAWWWLVLLGAVFLRGSSLWRQRGLRLMLFSGLGFLVVFCATYLCSTLPLTWHLNSLYRLLAMLQPWMLAVAAAAFAISDEHRDTDLGRSELLHQKQ